MKSLDFNLTIGESVAVHPELAKVFLEYGVDFCCGGDRNVLEAIKKDTASVDALLSDAEKAIEESETWLIGNGKTKLSELTSSQLISHIIGNHHSYLKEELPLLSQLLFKILTVHGLNHPELFDIHKLFGHLKTELESHLVKEETQLFPSLAEGTPYDHALIEELEAEHENAGDALHQLTALTDHFTLPDDACATYVLTYDKLRALVSDMYMHVHSENNILFKRYVKKGL